MDGWGDGYAQEDDDEDKSLELTSDQFEVWNFRNNIS
jgi:hypothetical protein